MTDLLERIIQEHNSGIGSTFTTPSHLCPYSLFPYICGFSGCRNLLFYIQRAWKKKRNRMISNEEQDTRAWATCGKRVITELGVKNYGVSASDLTMINLSKTFKVEWCHNSHCKHQFKFLNSIWKSNYYSASK